MKREKRLREEDEGRVLRDESRAGLFSQEEKRNRWMPRQLKAKKDVEACEKPRGVGKRAEIRGCLNGETHRGLEQRE